MAKITRNISLAQLGDLLQEKWEQGDIDNTVHDFIEAGLLPVQLLREKLKWVIEREGEGVRLTVENDEIDNVIRLRRDVDDSNDENEGLRRAA